MVNVGTPQGMQTCAGTNVIPMDVFQSRVSDQEIRALLQTAADSNMNMVRVWGGGYYPPDYFYDVCDELGLMVWQEAMFACSPYPRNEAFLDEVAPHIRPRFLHGSRSSVTHVRMP